MSNDTSWEKNALEALLLDNLKDKRSERRWRTFWRIVWLLIFGAALYSFFGPLKSKSSSVLGKHTALIKIEGEISSGTPANATNLIASLQAAFDSPDSLGIILQINSPGGSPVQSGLVYDEIMRLRQANPQKKLYVVVEDICASGAYYIAVAGEKIYVDKASLVGSIGVIMSGFGFQGVIDKLGVERRVLTAGENKSMLDPFVKQNPKHREALQKMIDEVHGQFIQVVKEGRGERLKNQPDLFSGMVWVGTKSIELGLADEIGSVDFVAREVIKNTDIIDYSQTDNYAERLAKRFGAEFGTSLSKALQQFSWH